ncbi:acyl-CoA dehydrogenase family protein [Pseudonocardia dioxanivorans]|uniref:acyl-CoA dehydrogenase family protein n=1 Tax=Pseudonocardia dioxanivorans TaxID=240495 RepID=UPI000CD05B07|nr:acyl-CoA dehydrogenase family protein [Pseudonocardia dioxanivorans]
MSTDALHPFRSADQLEFDIVDALLTHLPALWRTEGEGHRASLTKTAVRDAWDALCSLGVGGLLVPSEHGGQGASLSRTLSVAWALSRIPAPVPFLSSAIIAPLVAVALGERSLLTEIATGDTVVAIAFGGQAKGDGEWTTTLQGHADDVLHGADADRWLVVANRGEGKSVLLLIDQPVSALRDNSSDVTRPTVRARFEDVATRCLAEGPGPLLVEVVRRAHLVRCVEVLAAASVAAGDDAVAASSIASALTAVRSATAATDLHGTCDYSQLKVACTRTETVARLVRAQGSLRVLPGSARTDLCVQRATGEARWLPLETY